MTPMITNFTLKMKSSGNSSKTVLCVR